MGDIKTFEAQYIHTTRIELEEDYIVLREPTTAELRDFGEDSKKNMDILVKLFPDCIVEHSFTEIKQGKETKVGNHNVGALLSKSSSHFLPMLSTWADSLPFQKESSESSDKSAE